MNAIFENNSNSKSSDLKKIECKSKSLDLDGIDGLEISDLYQSSLWDIHDFVDKVISTKRLGFDIRTDRSGRKNIEPLPLGRYYRLINVFIARIPSNKPLCGYVSLFFNCCKELDLIYDQLSSIGATHRPHMTGADLFNSFLSLIRAKATDKPYKSITDSLAQNSKHNFVKSKDYIDRLFNNYSKLLVLRIDFGYLKESVSSIDSVQALQDFGHLIGNRRGNSLFEHCVGYIRKLEYTPDKGQHFHCFLFFNGQEQKKCAYVANLIGEYWKTLITDGRGIFYNCNAEKAKYEYCGIGLIDHSDVVMRTNLLYALTYLTKKDQSATEMTQSRCRTISRGVSPAVRINRPGPSRQVTVLGKKVVVPKTNAQEIDLTTVEATSTGEVRTLS